MKEETLVCDKCGLPAKDGYSIYYETFIEHQVQRITIGKNLGLLANEHYCGKAHLMQRLNEIVDELSINKEDVTVKEVHRWACSPNKEGLHSGRDYHPSHEKG